MKKIKKKLDLILLSGLVTVLLGLPFGIQAYHRQVKQQEVPAGAKEFTLTGNPQRGWMNGEVYAYEAISLWTEKGKIEKPVLEVSRGGDVTLQLDLSRETPQALCTNDSATAARSPHVDFLRLC
jgi:hypothetical protein